MQKHQCTKSDIARIAGIKPPSVSNWLDGSTKTLKAETLDRLVGYFKLNRRWLMKGVGPMDAAAAEESPMTEHVAQDTDEIRLLEDFRSIPLFLRPITLSLLRSFAALGASHQASDRFKPGASAAIGKSVSRLVEASISLRQ
jgi:transcriptional regulator with XRE-family HTH domain